MFETDWYVQLQSPTDVNLQLGLVARDHPSVPGRFRERPRGVLVTIEVDDVDAIHSRAGARGLEIVYAMRDEPWGQRHFMTVDPDGLAVDVVKVIPPSQDFLREQGLA